MRLSTGTLKSPIGELTFFVREETIVGLGLPDSGHELSDDLERRFKTAKISRTEPPRAIRRAFDAYFDRDYRALDELPIDPPGPPFFQEVWTVLRAVPAGKTVSYSELARIAGRPKAVRAAAGANAKNPIPLIIPCHRVIAADGTLWGFGGGLPMKTWLLRHEGVSINESGVVGAPETTAPARKRVRAAHAGSSGDLFSLSW